MTTAAARANKPFGFKAVVVREDGRTHIPVRRNFKTREEAIAYAQKYIDANAANAAKQQAAYRSRDDQRA